MKIGSLFSGYGGLDAAAEVVFNAETAWVSDIDPGACKVLAHRYPGVPNLGDITTIDWATVEPVDIITGGSPCQDLSHAGRRQGMTEGTRSNLWVAMREAIAVIRPSFVIWENVRGAMSAAADSGLEPCAGCMGDADDGPVLRALGRVLGDLADLGYDAQWHGLRAADVGAPHGRWRVFVVATDTRSEAVGRRAGLCSGAPSGVGRGRLGHDLGADEPDVVLLPTPTVQDGSNNGGASQHDRNTPPLNAVVTTFSRTPEGSEAAQQSTSRRAAQLLQVPRSTARRGRGRNEEESLGSALLEPLVDGVLNFNAEPEPSVRVHVTGGGLDFVVAETAVLVGVDVVVEGGEVGDISGDATGGDVLKDLGLGLGDTGVEDVGVPSGDVGLGLGEATSKGVFAHGLSVASVYTDSQGFPLHLLPTPNAQVSQDGETPETWLARRERVKAKGINGNGMGTPLTIAVQLLPTPTKGDGEGGGKRNDVTWDDTTRSTGDGGASRLRDVVGLLPTPRATDGTKGGPNQRGSSGDLMLPSAVQLLPTPVATDAASGGNRPTDKASHPGTSLSDAAERQSDRWGQYAAAIARWEAVLGRPAPTPTEPGKTGNPRLSPAFTEWMMGLPAGWITDVPGVNRNEALKLCGNGVVPQQAIAALTLMLNRN